MLLVVICLNVYGGIHLRDCRALELHRRTGLDMHIAWRRQDEAREPLRGAVMVVDPDDVAPLEPIL